MKNFQHIMRNIIFVRYDNDETSIEIPFLLSCDGMASFLYKR